MKRFVLVILIALAIINFGSVWMWLTSILMEIQSSISRNIALACQE